MRAARSMASSSVAGRPSMRATGRSSTWWLRNHALPRTQAFLALVMRWPSTVNSMSSQTQPQKVQVALGTIFNSAINVLLANLLQLLAEPNAGDDFLSGRHPLRELVAMANPAARLATIVGVLLAEPAGLVVARAIHVPRVRAR